MITPLKIKGQQMKTNNQTELLFSTESTEKLYEKLEDCVSVSIPGDLIEAAFYYSFVDFPLSADNILDWADRDLYFDDDNYTHERHYYTSNVSKEDKVALQKVLDLIARNTSAGLKLKKQTRINRILILQEDIDYFNETKGLSNRLIEWLSEVKKISQNRVAK